MIKVSVKKKSGFDGAVNRLIKSLSRELLGGLDDWSRNLKKDVVRALSSGSRSGRTYTINGRTHVASRAGEAPAKVTGELARSILLRKRAKRAGVVGRGIKTKRNVIQANWETGFGGRSINTSRSRPYMVSNFRRTKTRNMSNLVNRIRKVVT